MFHALISTKIRLTILYHEKISIYQKKASHPRKTIAYNLIFQQRGGRATLFTSGSDNLFSLSLSLSLSLFLEKLQERASKNSSRVARKKKIVVYKPAHQCDRSQLSLSKAVREDHSPGRSARNRQLSRAVRDDEDFCRLRNVPGGTIVTTDNLPSTG
jgi:hypothetical protein